MFDHHLILFPAETLQLVQADIPSSGHIGSKYSQENAIAAVRRATILR